MMPVVVLSLPAGYGKEIAFEIQPVFIVKIENDNLFVCLLIENTMMVDQTILRKKGGKKIKVKPVRKESCNHIIYLNSRLELKVKEKGIGSVRFYSGGRKVKIRIPEVDSRVLTGH